MGRKISVDAVIDWVRMRLGLVPSTPAATYGQFYLKSDGTHTTRLPNGTDWTAAKDTHTHGGSLPSFVVGDAGKFLNINGTGTATEWDLLTNADLPNSGVVAATYTAANVTVNAKGIVTSAVSNSDVALNTAARHVAATVLDGTGIDLGITGQQITASLTNTAVTPGTYNLTTLTVDAQGRITSASTAYAERAIVTVVASKNLLLTDRGTKQMCSAAGAIVLTVPTNVSVAFPVGTEIDIFRNGAGDVSVVAAGGVTIRTAATLAITAQWRAAHLTKIATDEWILIGAV